MLRLSSKIARQFSGAMSRSFETMPGGVSGITRHQQPQACLLPARMLGSKVNANASCFAEPSYICRNYSSGKDVEKTTTSASSESAKDSSDAVSKRKRPPTDFEKKIFVWTGKYKTANEVPEEVTEASLGAAKNKFRIYVNVGMGLATVVGAIAMIIVGKSRAKKGESVSKINIRRHPETYSKIIESQEAAK